MHGCLHLLGPNSVEGITITIEKIAKGIGQRVELCGDVRYTFPACKEVLCAGLDRLKEPRLGLKRAENIIAAAKRACLCSGDLDLVKLTGRPYTVAIRELKEFDGIGNKVANCIALFSLQKTEAFPVDRNIGRILADWYDDCPIPENYLSGQTDKLTDKQYATIVEWAQPLQPLRRVCGLCKPVSISRTTTGKQLQSVLAPCH